MTAAASAPLAAAWPASATVSAVVWAPQCTITVPVQASRKRTTARRRSSVVSCTPSPVVPQQNTPSAPPA